MKAGGASRRCLFRERSNFRYASSSIGRAAVSKTAGWGFESLLACQLRQVELDAQRTSSAQGMETKVEEQPTIVDTAKLAFAIVVVLAGLVGYYYFADVSALLRHSRA